MGSGASANDALTSATPEEIKEGVSALDCETRSKLCHALGLDVSESGYVKAESSTKEILPPEETFTVGQYVEAHSLKAVELNGIRGVVVGLQEGRVRVRCPGNGEKALKPSNLKKAEVDPSRGLGRFVEGKSVTELRGIITTAGFSYTDCVEKNELYARALQAMDACDVAREVSEGGQVHAKFVSVTILGMDGAAVLGPQEMLDDTPISDIIKELTEMKAPQCVDVKLCNGETLVSSKALLRDLQVNNVVELQCTFSVLTLSDSFAIELPDGGEVELDIAPCASREAFLEAVADKSLHGREALMEVKASTGRSLMQLLTTRNVIQPYSLSNPEAAKKLKDLIGCAHEVSLCLDGDLMVHAFFSGHRFCCTQDYAALMHAQQKARKDADIDKIGAKITSLFG